ncbi:aldehyde dehydrogenase family protein, partial [Rhodococcus chondri]
MLEHSALSRTEESVVRSVPTGLFIDGRWQDTDRSFPVVDPSTGRDLRSVADAGPDDGMRALDAAVAAQPAWAATTPRERATVLSNAHRLMLEQIDRLALITTLEMGKPLAEARGEIAYAAEFFRWFSEEAVRIDGGYMPAPGGGSRFLVSRQPVGPSLLVTPWNFPMAMGTRKIGPALAAGCTSVVKPAKQTPLSLLALADLLSEAGVPPGVVNVITTSKADEVMAPLILDHRSRKLSFTGSTAVGAAADRQCRHAFGEAGAEFVCDAPLDEEPV